MNQETGRGKPSSQKYCKHCTQMPPRPEVGLQPLTPSDRLPQGQRVRGDTSDFVLDTPGRHHLNQGLGVKTTCDKACG